jgi:hypothetical protein
MGDSEFYSRKEKLEDLRGRLKGGKLTAEDVEALEELIDERVGAEKIGGRPVIAHLPHGMDVIK